MKSTAPPQRHSLALPCASGREVTVVIALVIAFYSILYRIEFVLPSLHEYFVRLVDLPISPVAFPHD